MAQDLFGNRGTTKSIQGATIHSPTGGSIFADVPQYKPRQYTPKQQEEMALEQSEAQRFAEAQYIIDGLTGDPRWIDATYQRRQEYMDDWKANNWPVYATAKWGPNYQLNPEAQASWLQINGALQQGYEARLGETEQASSLGNLMGKFAEGADKLYDYVNLLPVVPSMYSQTKAQDALRNMESGIKLVQESKTLTQEQKDAYYAMQAARRPEIEADLAQAQKEAAPAIKEWTGDIVQTAANQDARKAANTLTANRAKRVQELAEAGSLHPGWDAWVEAGLAEKFSLALEGLIGQVPNFAATVIPTAVAGAIGTLTGSPAAGATAATATAGVVNSLMVAAQNGGEVAERVMMAPIEQLEGLPEFRALIKGGYAPEDARQRIASVAALEALPTGAAIGLIGGFLGPEAMAVNTAMGTSILSRLGRTIIGRTGAAMGLSAVQEGGEEFFEGLNTNIAWDVATGDTSKWSVVDDVFMGTLTGAFLGGGGNVAAETFRKYVMTPPAEGDNSPAARLTRALRAAGIEDLSGITSPLISNTDGSLGPAAEAMNGLFAFRENKTLPTVQELIPIFDKLRQAESLGLTAAQITDILNTTRGALELTQDYNLNWADEYAAYVATLPKVSQSALPNRMTDQQITERIAAINQEITDLNAGAEPNKAQGVAILQAQLKALNTEIDNRAKGLTVAPAAPTLDPNNVAVQSPQGIVYFTGQDALPKAQAYAQQNGGTLVSPQLTTGGNTNGSQRQQNSGQGRQEAPLPVPAQERQEGSGQTGQAQEVTSPPAAAQPSPAPAATPAPAPSLATPAPAPTPAPEVSSTPAAVTEPAGMPSPAASSPESAPAGAPSLTPEEQEIADQVNATPARTGPGVRERTEQAGNWLYTMARARTVPRFNDIQQIFMDLLELERRGVHPYITRDLIAKFQEARPAGERDYVGDFDTLRLSVLGDQAAPSGTPNRPFSREQQVSTLVRRMIAAGRDPQWAEQEAEILYHMAETLGAIAGVNPAEWIRSNFNFNALLDLMPGEEATAADMIEAFERVFIDEANRILTLPRRQIADWVAREQLQEDMDALLAWATRRKGGEGTWTEEMHRRVAKAFGTYMRTAKAPNPELESVFSKMREWLTTLYEAFRAFMSSRPISKSITAVFDRQLTGVNNGRVRQTGRRRANSLARLLASTDRATEAVADITDQPNITESDERNAGDNSTATGGGTGGTAQQNAGAPLANVRDNQQQGGPASDGTNSGPDNTGVPQGSASANLGERGVTGAASQRASNDQQSAGVSGAQQPQRNTIINLTPWMPAAPDPINLTPWMPPRPTAADLSQANLLVIANTVTIAGPALSPAALQALENTSLGQIAQSTAKQDTTTTNLIVQDNRDSVGDRILGQFPAPQGVAVKALVQALSRIEPADQQLLWQSWVAFAGVAQPETIEDVSALQSTYLTALCHAMLDSTRTVPVDPWYTTMVNQMPNLAAFVDGLASSLYQTGMSLAENSLTPIVIDTNGARLRANQIGTETEQFPRAVLSAMAEWLQSHGEKVWPKKKSAIIVLPHTGMAHLVRRRNDGTFAIRQLSYFPGRQYGDGLAFGGVAAVPESTAVLTFNIRDTRGNTNVWRGFVQATQTNPADANYSGRQFKPVASFTSSDTMATSTEMWEKRIKSGFSGKVFFLRSEFDHTAMQERSQVRGAATPENAPESTTAVSPAEIPLVTQAAQNPGAGVSPMATPMNEATDATIQGQMANAIASSVNATEALDIDVLASNEFSPNDSPTLANPGPSINQPTETLSPVQEAAVVSEQTEDANTRLAENGPPENFNGTQDINEPEEVDPIVNVYAKTLREILDDRFDAAESASPRDGEFSPEQHGAAVQATNYRKLCTFMRTTFVDKSSPFLQWLTTVAPVTTGSYNDHATWKAWSVGLGRTRNAKQAMVRAYVQPYINFVEKTAKRMGLDMALVNQHLGYAATHRHILFEAAAQYRQLKVLAIQEAMAAVDTGNKAALIAEAQEDLAKYDRWQEFGRPEDKTRTMGGFRNVESQAYLANLLKMGYTQAELDQASSMLTTVYENITHERLKHKTLLEEEANQWFKYLFYVPLTVKMESNRTQLNDTDGEGNIFNPRQDYKRMGSLEKAEPASHAIDKYLDRASMEIGMASFTEQLYNLYQELALRGNTHGLRAVSFTEIERMAMSGRPELVNLAMEYKTHKGFVYTRKVVGAEGQPVVQKYLLTFVDQTDAEGNVIRDENGNIPKEASGQVLRDALSMPARGATMLDNILGAAGTATRTYAQLHTKYRMLFAPVNGGRDTIERAFNSTSRTFKDKDGNILEGTFMGAKALAMTANPRMMLDFADAFLLGDTNSKYGRYFAEFERSGAYYQFNDSMGQITERQRGMIERQMRKFLHTIPGFNVAKFFAQGGANIINKWNDFFNVFPAFVSYATMRENNMTHGDAEFWVLDMMNFFVEGTVTRGVSAILPFFRPTMQTAANVLRSMGLSPDFKRNKKAALRAWATFGAAIMGFTMILPLVRVQMGDDDDTGKNRFDAMTMSQLNAFVPLGLGDGGYMKLPTGFGPIQTAWNVAVAMQKLGEGLTTPGDAIFHILLSATRNMAPDTYPDYNFADAPAEFIIQTIAPMLSRPLVDVAVNKNNWGNPIDYVEGGGTRRKSEQGWHTTPQVWKDIAKWMYENAGGFDVTPEEVRAFFNGYMAGPLQGLVGWMEADNLYKSAAHKSTRDNIGPLLTALGASAVYNSEMNISTAMFYRHKEELERKIRHDNVRTTDPANSGSTAKKTQFLITQLTNAGWSVADIQRYLIIEETDRLTSKRDRSFRSVTEGLRREAEPSDIVSKMYWDWSTQKDQDLTNAVIRLENLRSIPQIR